MVFHANYGSAALFGGGNLFQYPLFQIGADSSAGLMFVYAGICIVSAVPGAVNGNDGKPILGTGRIGKAAALFSFLWLEGSDYRFIMIGNIRINLLKIFLGSPAGRCRDTKMCIRDRPTTVCLPVVPEEAWIRTSSSLGTANMPKG